MSFDPAWYMSPASFFELAQAQPERWRQLRGKRIEHIDRGIGTVTELVMVTRNMGRNKYCDGIFVSFAHGELKLKPEDLRNVSMKMRHFQQIFSVPLHRSQATVC